jgi:hypothetical protein
VPLVSTLFAVALAGAAPNASRADDEADLLEAAIEGKSAAGLREEAARLDLKPSDEVWHILSRVWSDSARAAGERRWDLRKGVLEYMERLPGWKCLWTGDLAATHPRWPHRPRWTPALRGDAGRSCSPASPHAANCHSLFERNHWNCSDFELDHFLIGERPMAATDGLGMGSKPRRGLEDGSHSGGVGA